MLGVKGEKEASVMRPFQRKIPTSMAVLFELINPNFFSSNSRCLIVGVKNFSASLFTESRSQFNCLENV